MSLTVSRKIKENSLCPSELLKKFKRSAKPGWPEKRPEPPDKMSLANPPPAQVKRLRFLLMLLPPSLKHPLHQPLNPKLFNLPLNPHRLRRG
jgi:hypothetical protein